MTEQEFSHIEIVEDDEQELPVVDQKNLLLKKLVDLEGWKKDLKKIGYILALLVVIAVIIVGVRMLVANPFGIRMHAPLEVVTYQKYSNAATAFVFSFPEGYVFDGDEQKKYGADYLAGFYLEADQRTGCDVRSSGVGINFAKSDQEIADAIKEDLAIHVKGFADFSSKRIKLDGRDAMQTNFSLTDPLGNTLQITQLMTSNDGKDYLIACGSGKAQYKFFQQDFQDFINSFEWRK
ncbi:MAG: hypothetical protein HGA36_03725 [Candidatus Moranbacteria bacterium]|nr:hypothetical protein [Candidatus Moranbacteria bacterium]